MPVSSSSPRDQGAVTRDEILTLQDLCNRAGQAGVDVDPVLDEVATDLPAAATRPQIRCTHAACCALRYIITHLIEETARHNGHLDILRELADGVTGD